jgi:hypothetical protein
MSLIIIKGSYKKGQNFCQTNSYGGSIKFALGLYNYVKKIEKLMKVFLEE